MHIELSIGDNSGIELGEVVFLRCIFVGIAAVVAFVPSTLQLDFLNGSQLLKNSSFWVIVLIVRPQRVVCYQWSVCFLFFAKITAIYIQSSENDLPCT